MEWSGKGTSGRSRPHHLQGCPIGPCPSVLGFSAGHYGAGSVVGGPPRTRSLGWTCAVSSGPKDLAPSHPCGPVPSLQPRWDVQGGHAAWSGDRHGGRAGSGVPATAFHSLLGVLLSCGRSQSGVEPRSGQVCAPLRLRAWGWEQDVGLAQPSPLCSIPSFPATTLVHVARVTGMLYPLQPLSSPIGPF